MLTILLPATDDSEAVVLQFEHSLVSLSKWEAIHEKAFYGRDPKTYEETMSYIDQMLLSENPPEGYLQRFDVPHMEAVNDYINSKQSATWFREEPGSKGSGETVTSELIYYWLIQFQIPFDCETWHLNRVMTLVKICGIKQTKPKKMSRAAQAAQYRQLNAERRARLGTSG